MTYNAQDELRIHVIMLMKSTKNTNKIELSYNNAGNIIFGDIGTSIGDAKEIGPCPSSFHFCPFQKYIRSAYVRNMIMHFLKGTKTSAEKENVRLCPKICKFLEK
jgi:hypothetical protein